MLSEHQRGPVPTRLSNATLPSLPQVIPAPKCACSARSRRLRPEHGPSAPRPHWKRGIVEALLKLGRVRRRSGADSRSAGPAAGSIRRALRPDWGAVGRPLPDLRPGDDRVAAGPTFGPSASLVDTVFDRDYSAHPLEERDGERVPPGREIKPWTPPWVAPLDSGRPILRTSGLMINGMRQDHSWGQPGAALSNIYEHLPHK